MDAFDSADMKKAVDRLTEQVKATGEAIVAELRLTREQGASAAKINDFNWKQVEAMTQGGVVGAAIIPPGAGPRRM